MKLVSFFVSIVSIGGLLCYHGFALSDETGHFIQSMVEVSFAYYCFHYFARIFYDFSPIQFVRANWFEGIMVLTLILEGIAHNFFNVVLVEGFFNLLGIEGAGAISVVFLQFYLFIVVFFELSESTNIVSNMRLHPAGIFVISYMLIISMGTTLLMMPEMTNIEGSMRFLDALFTAVSATCVTGLSVVDPGSFFTFKGHFVIMMLMQVGGLTIVSFAYLAAFLNRFGIGLKQDDILRDLTSKDALFTAKGTLIRIFSLSILIESIGAACMYFLLTPDMPFKTELDRVFFCVFHAVSAFNNAGFSNVTDGLYSTFLRDAYILHLVVALLILLGSFGFTVLFDLFTPSLLRDRLKHPWKRPHMSTLLAVRTHLILVVIGMVLFMFGEFRNVLASHNFVESSITSLFHSISSRTAGFNTVDFHSLGESTILMFIFLMFIGGNTFSTAGGIKTSTIAVIAINTYSIIRGKKNVEVLGRTIPTDVMLKAGTILITFAGTIFACTYILSFTESHILAMPDRSMLDIIFEEVSAMATCGLSTGITSMISDPGRVVLIFSMFIGRVGTLTIIFAFARKILTNSYSYPEEQIMIG